MLVVNRLLRGITLGIGLFLLLQRISWEPVSSELGILQIDTVKNPLFTIRAIISEKRDSGWVRVVWIYDDSTEGSYFEKRQEVKK